MTLVWASGYNGITDPAAQTYIAAVEAADGQALEGDVALAINDFVVGCKLDGIWDAIKASCILAGARTLSGALVPLKGTAPTNNNFVAGNYNRKTGLKGQVGSTKYLDSNRPESADPQNNNHLAIYVSEPVTPPSFTAYIGGGSVSGSLTELVNAPNNLVARNRNVSGAFQLGSSVPIGTATFLGTSRSTSTQYNTRILGVDRTHTGASTTPTNVNICVFARNLSTGPTLIGDARTSFYSIGESLDLALLDNRVSTLMTDIGAAIP